MIYGRCFFIWFLFTILIFAAFFDVKYRRIPNWLIILGFIGAVILFPVSFTTTDICSKIIAVILPFLFSYPIYKIGAVGAGDIKLICLLGFFLSLRKVFSVILLSLIIAAVFSLIKMLYLKIFITRMQYFFSYLMKCISDQKVYPYITEKPSKKHTVTLAFPVLLSSMAIIGGSIYESYYGGL